MYSQHNPHHTDHIWIYRQRIVDLLTVVNKLLIHKQPRKTSETDEVNQLHLTPLFEFKAMKANEKDFYSFYVLGHVYASFIPLVQLNVLSLSLLQSFIFFLAGGLGTALMP